MHPLLIVGGGIAVIALLASLFKSKPNHDGSVSPPPQLPATSLDDLPPGDGEDDAPIPVDAQTEADIKEEIKSEKAKLPKILPSPFTGIHDEQWTEYVKRQKTGRLNTITPSYMLGLFLMGMRILQDLGYAKNVKLTQREGKQVYMGDWAGPYSLNMYLGDAMLQYEAFHKMSILHGKHIASTYKIPVTIDGVQVTLSGLLGVAKRAGLAGLKKWVEEPATRKPETTAEMKRVNNIF